MAVGINKKRKKKLFCNLALYGATLKTGLERILENKIAQADGPNQEGEVALL